MATADETGDTFESEDRAVVLRDIKKTFDGGSIVACEDIDLDIQPDEFVVLLGPSGCGKTTTLRCIAGLEDPDEGQVLIGDEEVTHAKPKDRDLAFVFQSIALFPHMSVRENMQFGLDMQTDLSEDEKNERVDEASEMLGIAEMVDRSPNELSGGQQQRVALGRAMVMEPAAFLLDEPFSALDANLRDQMQTEIQKLHRQLNTAMIFVTHDQQEAMTLGDKIVVMDDGHIQQIASPYDIYNDPANQFVASFIGSPSTNLVEGSVEVQDGTVTVATDLADVALPDADSERFSSYDGDTLTVGIRPENFDLQGGEMFSAEIELVEPQGSMDVIHLAAEELSVRATTDQGVIGDREGETVSVGFEPGAIWLFDEDGERLR
jgi:multiple sugar transport system ATP-binding protein